MNRFYDTVFLGADNYVPLTLKDGNAPLSGGLASITRAVATLTQVGESDVVIDSDVSPNAFDWTTQSDESVIRLTFGNESIPEGQWQVRLETFDGAATNVVWCDPKGPSQLILQVTA